MKRSPLSAAVLGLLFVAMLVVMNRTPDPLAGAPGNSFLVGAICSVVGGVWIWRQWQRHGAWMAVLCGVAATTSVILIALGVIR